MANVEYLMNENKCLMCENECSKYILEENKGYCPNCMTNCPCCKEKIPEWVLGCNNGNCLKCEANKYCNSDEECDCKNKKNDNIKL